MAGGVDYPFQTLNANRSVVALNGTTSVLILAANANRRNVILRNASSDRVMYVSLTSPATQANANIVINPGHSVSLKEGDVVWTGELYATMANALARNIVVTEYLF